MNTKPKSPYGKTGGMTWFPRMLDKIRLYAKGELHPDFHANLGLPMGADGFCCRYLRVAYPVLKERVLGGGTDDEILQWCFELGRKLDETDLFVWNEFVRKFGWNDQATPVLARLKAQSGLVGRSEISTLCDYMEVDEGRKP
jgi:gluconokinase